MLTNVRMVLKELMAKEKNKSNDPFSVSTKLRGIYEKIQTDRWMKRIVLAFFVVYFALGCLLFRDYGVSTDEIFQIDKARITLDYVFGRNDALLTYPDRHYGAIFPILLDLGGWFFSDSRDIFLYRHFITFLFFLLIHDHFLPFPAQIRVRPAA